MRQDGRWGKSPTRGDIEAMGICEELYCEKEERLKSGIGSENEVYLGRGD